MTVRPPLAEHLEIDDHLRCLKCGTRMVWDVERETKGRDRFRDWTCPKCGAERRTAYPLHGPENPRADAW